MLRHGIALAVSSIAMALASRTRAPWARDVSLLPFDTLEVVNVFQMLTAFAEGTRLSHTLFAAVSSC